MFSIEFIDETTSTNDAVRASNKPNHVIVAAKQTKGRGQKGNTWESEEGKNLTFSTLIIPDFLSLTEQFYISKTVSNSLVITLKRYGIPAQVKWPNDIYVGSKKICGILIENDVTASGKILRSTIGVGLNVNQTEFLSDAPNPISMKQVAEKDFDIENILTTFTKVLELQYKTLEAGYLHEIDTYYENNLYLLNQWAPFKEGGKAFNGKIVKVKSTGELLVEKDNGEISSYIFKEIEYEINNIKS
ncbi:MAG: biotin--[acetyl-CoA-carboxylase] ligase [Rikenellaceae bacterium]